MLRIGDFSKLTGVPAKTIRYYEEEGLLIPAQVDTMTGYRQYDQRNIEELLKILYLKSLGFKLAEIRDFDDTAVIKKSKELKQKMREIRKSLNELSNLYKDEKGELIMKNFINDEKLVGKWQLLGTSVEKKDALLGKVKPDRYFALKNLVFLPKGEKYWVITFWTKGYIFFKDKPLKYEFVDGKLIIEFKYDNEVEFYAVYKNIDHKAYKQDEVMFKDDISMPFKDDKNLVGVWSVCGFVQDIKDFKGDMKKDYGYFKDVAIMENGNLLFTLSDGGILKDKIRWTKGYIIFEIPQVAQKYIIKELNGEKYLFMEHKSGDYSFGGMKPMYYVFKKSGN